MRCHYWYKRSLKLWYYDCSFFVWTYIYAVKLKFHGSSFFHSILLASLWHPCEDVANESQGNRACRTCRTRMLWENHREDLREDVTSICYAENGPVELKLYAASRATDCRRHYDYWLTYTEWFALRVWLLRARRYSCHDVVIATSLS